MAKSEKLFKDNTVKGNMQWNKDVKTTPDRRMKDLKPPKGGNFEERVLTDVEIKNDPREMLRNITKITDISINEILERVNTRKKRHYDYYGNIVIYTKVKKINLPFSDFPLHNISSLLVSTDLKEKVPEIKKEENAFIIKSIFKPLSIKQKTLIDPFIIEYSTNQDYLRAEGTPMTIDSDSYSKAVIETCLLDWNLDIEIQRDNIGRLSEKTKNEIYSLYPSIIDSISRDFVNLNDVSEQELAALERQASVLFSENSKGVTNALEGVSLYCEASLFAKEFSLSPDNFDKLPSRIGKLIRFMANKSNEAEMARMERNKNKSKSVSKNRISGGK